MEASNRFLEPPSNFQGSFHRLPWKDMVLPIKKLDLLSGMLCKLPSASVPPLDTPPTSLEYRPAPAWYLDPAVGPSQLPLCKVQKIN